MAFISAKLDDFNLAEISINLAELPTAWMTFTLPERSTG